MPTAILVVGPISNRKLKFARVEYPGFVHINSFNFRNEEEEQEALISARNSGKDIIILSECGTKESREFYIKCLSRIQSHQYKIGCCICDNCIPKTSSKRFRRVKKSAITRWKEFDKTYSKPDLIEGFSFLSYIDASKYTSSIYCEKGLFIDFDSLYNAKDKLKKSEICITKNASETINLYRRWGYFVIVVSNRTNIYTEFDDHDFVMTVISKLDAFVDDVMLCPNEDSPYRIPNPGFAWEAQRKFMLDLSNSIMVGSRHRGESFVRNSGIGTFIEASMFFRRNSTLNNRFMHC